jgi:hypothetical protein
MVATGTITTVGNGEIMACRYCGHEQLISNGGRFKPVFAESDRKQTMIDLRGISTNWFKNKLCSSIRYSRLRAQALQCIPVFVTDAIATGQLPTDCPERARQDGSTI